MKKIFTCTLAYLLLKFNVYAQLDESKNFIYLYPDSVVHASQIYLERDYNGFRYFLVDGRRVNPAKVKFFNTQDGFFASTSDLNLLSDTQFLERIRKGRINVYEDKFINWDDFNHSGYFSYRDPEVVFTKNYYNIGYGPLKKATYSNLKQDMSNDAESLKLLKRYSDVKRAEKGFYIAAGASILAGMLSFVITGFKDQNTDPGVDHSFPNFGPSFILLGAGVGFGFTGFTKTLKAPRYLKAAIDVYNSK